MNMLQGYVREANAFLEDDDEGLADASGTSAAGGMPPAAAGAAPPGSGSGFLFEGQLSGAEPPPRQPDLMSLLGSALGHQLAAAQAAAQQQQQQQQPTEGGGPAAADQQQQVAAAAGPPPDVLEAIERELDAIAVQVRWPTTWQLVVAIVCPKQHGCSPVRHARCPPLHPFTSPAQPHLVRPTHCR